jgi:predicted dinucleotide-binding enzyme
MPLSADAPPVDRSRVSRALSPEEREAADVILAFRAACIVDSPGGLVDAQHLVRRYQAWAGNRALAPEAFLALFADVSGFKAVDMGGLPHVSGLALRAAPGLKAVA